MLCYKPYDVLCRFGDRQADTETTPEPKLTLKDFIPLPDIYPVGRLDRDSEGLVLLTNHGWSQHRLSHPRFGHGRTYWVQVEGIPEEPALEQLRQGVMIQGIRTLPADVHCLQGDPPLPPRHPPIRFRKTVPTQWLSVTLREGRNRQVRRMTAAVGYPTLRLVRVSFTFEGRSQKGKPGLQLQLGDLQPGQWRLLTPLEQQLLMKTLRSF